MASASSAPARRPRRQPPRRQVVRGNGGAQRRTRQFPIHTGTVGADSRNAVHRSVPPDIEQIWTCLPTASATQRKPSGDNGAPVEPSARTVDRSNSIDRTKASLETCVDVWRGDAEVGDAVFLRDLPQCPRSGWPGLPSYRTTVEPSQQTGDEQVPHHPAGGREPEEPLARAEIVMEPERLQMLDDDSAVPVHDPLGEPGRA